ncbi:MAG: ABC transporter ATP-binding protein [Treponema sp.]|jgi:simple sugar transport system ATP-binding protein|nr:ABC transporter ATP-binding protein [Treponema sp.]
MAETASCLLEMRNICKYFSGVRANHNINLEISRGEVHALLGENGAGKTTLMNILYGLYAPTSGEIFWKGQKIEIKSPKNAIDLGIGMVHQHFMLIPALSVVENVVLGTKNKRRGLLNLEGAAETLVSLAGQYNMRIDPWARVSQLTVGQQQRLEILKALYKGADLLILDEPTAVLTPQEVEELFLMIKKLTGENHTVIFISHKLNEIMAVCERVTVLSQGETVKTLDTKDTDRHGLARFMIGRDLSAAVEKKPLAPKNKILEVRELNCFNSKGVRAIKNVSFDLRGGEILGVAGVDGNGQRELVDALTGLCPIESGHILINGYDVTNRPPREILEYKVAHIPEDRHKRGIVLSMNVRENMILMNYYKEPVSKHKILRGDVIDSIYEGLLKKYQIKSPGGDEPIKNLSGGNQQKVVLARELSKSPDLLIAMYPMRGLDVGASEYIRGRLLEERDRGCAVLLISTELEEIISLSDRICVLYEGEIMGELPASGADIQRIGLMMAGAKKEAANHAAAE